MKSIKVKIKKLNKEGLETAKPAYATAGAAGVDLHACLDKEIVLQPGEICKVPTGWAIELPDAQTVALVFARSGLASKHGITLINGVGVVDSDYRGEVQVPLINLGRKAFPVRPGERIAQMVFLPVLQAELEEVNELGVTERGAGGFGSTGV